MQLLEHIDGLWNHNAGRRSRMRKGHSGDEYGYIMLIYLVFSSIRHPDCLSKVVKGELKKPMDYFEPALDLVLRERDWQSNWLTGILRLE